MNIDFILDTILKKTFTLHDFKRRVRIIKFLLEKASFGRNFNETFSPEESEWYNSLPTDLFQNIDVNSLYPFFESLAAKMKLVTPLIIYLSFDPEAALVEQIGLWLRSNLNDKRTLMDIKIDPTLIGGCAIVTKGIYRDYSVKGRIDQQKLAVIESLGSFK